MKSTFHGTKLALSEGLLIHYQEGLENEAKHPAPLIINPAFSGIPADSQGFRFCSNLRLEECGP